MGGGPCVVIIDGQKLRGAAFELATTADASCQLVEYLRTEENWDEADTADIEAFHQETSKEVTKRNERLQYLNNKLAKKYNRE